VSQNASTFIYVTYIRTTPDKVWAALTNPEIMRRYWLGATGESDFKPGSPWRLVFDDGRVADAGEIVEAEPNRRLVIKWRNHWKPEFHDEGWSVCTMELEEAKGAVKLTVTHSMDRPESKLIGAVSGGWPQILSNLKTLLETGEALFGDK
jgi:uncharacterized protein YndB with AHSA1/START domain